MTHALQIAKAVFTAYSEDKLSRLAASIAYATIFAIAPLLILMIAIAGFIVGVSNGGHGHHVVEDQLVAQIQAHVGGNSAQAIRQMIDMSFNKPRQSIIAQVLGWITFIVGAGGLFAALQDSLNAVWHVESTKGGWKYMLRDRLASFGMILVVGFMLIVTFGANAALTFLSAHYFANIPVVGSPLVLEAINAVLTIAVEACIFAAMYKILPDVDIKWRDVWGGALVTAVLFVVGEALISLYISYAGIASAYGAAGSILVALVWIYYSAVIMLLGAEYTKITATQARTPVPTVVRGTVDAPAGIDPRRERPKSSMT